MSYVRRLSAVGAILALAAVFANSHVWGEPAKPSLDKKRTGLQRQSPDKADQTFTEDLANSKFAKGGVLTYRTTAGDVLFSLQIQPKLPVATKRPRDYLIMVDTSASQVKGPLAAAQEITEALTRSLNATDRVELWTVNTPRTTINLTRGFRSPQAPQVEDALKTLKAETPFGNTDLKEGLKKAMASFEGNPERQQVIVFLGDGMSVYNPITDQERVELCKDMVKSGITFFPVPLGPRLDPKNLHGLATGTGGMVVRKLPGDKVADTVKRMHEAVATPVFYPKTVQWDKDVTDAFPSVLPPLRADAPTLVVGRIKPGQNLSYRIDGTVGGQEVGLEAAEKIPDAETENFFLVSIFEQWKNAKDQPALTRADRALAYQFEQSQLARAELIAQAEWAMSRDKLEEAQVLFEQAKQLDPQDVEADAGLEVVKKFRAGTLKKKQWEEQLAKADKSALMRRLAQEPSDKARPKGAAAPPPPQEDLLQQQKDIRAVEEQRITQVVDEALRKARQQLPTDPETSKELLKRTLATVEANPDLGDRVRQLQINRLVDTLRNVETRGAVILQDREQQLARLAQAQQAFNLLQEQLAEQGLTRQRMSRFANLMNQARYEDAYIQALAIREDAINSGKAVPLAATGGYDVGLVANNLSQLLELKRTREERWLLVLMQAERSHVPFPDEPPIQFPPAATWREITKLRKEKYENSGFTEDDPITLQQIKKLRNKLSTPINMEKGIDANTQFKDAIEFLVDRYDIPIVIDSAAFKADNQDESVEDKPVKLPRMIGVSLSTVLRLLTAQVNGTYLVRRDYIEITTGQRAVAEKVIRVYPVADLVTAIPMSFNPLAVGGMLNILGTSPGLGLVLGGPQVLGGLGQGLGLGGVGGLGALGLGGLGGFGGGLGGLGGLGGGLGGLGGGLGGFGGGALGFAGGGLGGQGGFGGGLGFGGGAQNFGVGGGGLGFGGGQLGQLGNLGGQFGLQGGDQSQILVRLIRDVVGNPKEWAPINPLVRRALEGQAAINPADREDDPGGSDVDPALWNSLGYFPPARALVVKASSRIHTNLGGPTTARVGPPGMGALNRVPEGALVFEPKKDRKRQGADKPEVRVAANVPKEDKKANADQKPKNLASGKKPDKALAERDAKKIWQDALAKGVDDPGVIIAVADFLAQCKKFDHVVEFLKADLRLGIVVRPWVYESLAVALEASGGSPEDIERARLSVVDLEPQDAQSYVSASKAMADLNQWDRAVAFCRQAALLEPNVSYPYEEAMLYAEAAKDADAKWAPDAMKWAAGNLLRQEWPVDNKELHAKASRKLEDFAQRLERQGRKTEAEQMVNSVNTLRQRDLSILLSWVGDADLDLEVKEPIGTTCSFLQRQTPGGGILLGDTLADTAHESYVAAKAFSGEYQVTIRRIWGRPLGGKATLEIIQHQGTPRESRRRETVVFDRKHTMTVALDDGRRTRAEYVPPPATNQRPKKNPDTPGANKVLAQLQALADPRYSVADSGMSGGLASLGVPNFDPDMPKAGAGRAADMVLYQTKIGQSVANTFDLTAQATLDSGGTPHWKLTPVFQSVNKAPSRVAVTNPLIPGSSAGGGD